MAELPSQEYLRSRIDYNPETGEARWKPVDQSYGSTWRSFNTRYSGKIISKCPRLQGIMHAKSRVIYKLYYGVDAKAIYFLNGKEDYTLSNLSNTRCEHNYIMNKVISKPVKSVIIKEIDPAIATFVRLNHKSGEFIWLRRNDTSFNTKYAGKIAGTISRYGYKILHISSLGSFRCHRVAWMMYYGTDPVLYEIDHIDKNRSNNNVKNLRLATRSLNQQAVNTRKVFEKNDNGKYLTRISIKNTLVSLGAYDTEQEARAAYESALEKYKPIYQFTPEEQAMLDELYANYPNVTKELQHACHALQVKALNHYTQAVENETVHRSPR